MHVPNSIASIIEAYNCQDIGFSVNAKLAEFITENSDGMPTNYIFHTSKAELKKIISAIRNKILEWAILLEENGIIGEGISFSEKEKKVAKETPVINNYTNNFYGQAENTSIQQGCNRCI